MGGIMRTHYDVLGVDRHADADQIATAYRFLAGKFHPDVNPGREQEARRRFLDVQTAFDVLSDPLGRIRYDAEMDAASEPTVQFIERFEPSVIEPDPLAEAVFIPPATQPRRKHNDTLLAWFLTLCIIGAIAIVAAAFALKQ